MGRDSRVLIVAIAVSISIHAPRVGRDMAGTMRSSTTSYFNPRAPCGARLTPQRGRRAPKKISIHAPRVGRDLAASELPPSIVLFQSTRPVWGATAIRGARARAEAISIHAPRVGRDKGRGENLVVTLDISIHAPRVGRDRGTCWRLGSVQISIHAPRVGRDYRRRLSAALRIYFNPRAPCGARPPRRCRPRGR